MYSIKNRIKNYFEPFAFALWCLIMVVIVAVHWFYETLRGLFIMEK